MVKLPPYLIVGDIPLRLWYDKDAVAATQARGQYLGDQQKIMIDKKLPPSTLYRTLLHEALHGVFSTSTLCAGTEDKWEVPPELQEKICTLLERELPILLKANPWLVEGLSATS